VIGRVLGPAGLLELTSDHEVMQIQYFLVAHEGSASSDEGRRAAWLPLGDALECLTFSDARSLLRDAWSRLPERLGASSSPSRQ